MDFQPKWGLFILSLLPLIGVEIYLIDPHLILAVEVFDLMIICVVFLIAWADYKTQHKD